MPIPMHLDQTDPAANVRPVKEYQFKLRGQERHFMDTTTSANAINDPVRPVQCPFSIKAVFNLHNDIGTKLLSFVRD